MLKHEGLEALHTAFNSFAPNGRVQARLTKSRMEMEAEGETTEEIARMISGALFDGLAYGNWFE